MRQKRKRKDGRYTKVELMLAKAHIDLHKEEETIFKYEYFASENFII